MPHDHARPRTAGRRRAAGIAVVVLTASVLAACGGHGRVSATLAARPTGAAAPSAVDPHLLSVLEQSWTGYKQVFMGADGRVSDPTRGGITTSEGESYALLRAVWMGDRPTFDAVWQWTAANLQVRGDGLFASLWGSGAVRDHNSATDADSDMALALLFAARRFGEVSYRSAAIGVLAGIWDHDVTSINGTNVLTAGNWAAQQASPGPVIDPSYFAPYAYRVFAREDMSHPWSTLIDSSYTFLDRCTAATLGGALSVGLPPNWCAISRATGAVVSFAQIAGASDYGYDAFRVMWRVALDALWNKEPRARDYLSRNDFLRRRWSTGQRLDPVYAHNGTVVSGYDDPTVYGGDIGSFVIDDPAAAAQIAQRILASFHPGAPAYFGQSDNYFEQNWAWFGLALFSGALTDLDRG